MSHFWLWFLKPLGEFAGTVALLLGFSVVVLVTFCCAVIFYSVRDWIARRQARP